MNKKWSKFILVICGIFLVLCMFFCNLSCIFYYVEYDPLDETIYMDVVPSHIKLLNSGIVIKNNNIEKIVDIK